jgi:hypothetical protein
MMHLIAFLLLGMESSVTQSPRVEALGVAVRAGKSAAVEAFWNDFSRYGGTPLIQCPTALAPDCLVTFL